MGPACPFLIRRSAAVLACPERFEALEFRLADPGRFLLHQGKVWSGERIRVQSSASADRLHLRATGVDAQLFLFTDILVCASSLKGDKLGFLWKVNLQATEVSSAPDGKVCPEPGAVNSVTDRTRRRR